MCVDKYNPESKAASLLLSSFSCRMLGYSDIQGLQTLVPDAFNVVDLSCMAVLNLSISV